MNEVVTAERKPNPVDVQKAEPKVLAIGGALLLGLSAIFLWRELTLANEVLAVVGSVAAAALAFLAHKKEKAGIGPIVLGIAGLATGAWYGASKEPVLLIGMGVAFVASLVLTLRAQKVFAGAEARIHRAMSWVGMAINGLIASFATYFFVFDATESSLNEFIARRSLLTLSWLIAGVVMVVAGRKRAATEIRDAGFLVLATSMVKLLVYDLGHTDGVIRIGALAIGGAVLMVASQLMGKLNAKAKA